MSVSGLIQGGARLGDAMFPSWEDRRGRLRSAGGHTPPSDEFITEKPTPVP